MYCFRQAGAAAGAVGVCTLLWLGAVPQQPAQAITAEQLLYLEVWATHDQTMDLKVTEPLSRN